MCDLVKEVGKCGLFHSYFILFHSALCLLHEYTLYLLDLGPAGRTPVGTQ